MKALVLAGGSGTRFWPVSRSVRPKQLLTFDGERSLLQLTVERLQPLISPESVWVCTTRSLAEPTRQQLPTVPEEQILKEPVGRNTAAAVGWAVTSMPFAERHEVVAVLPSDHWVADPAAFRSTLAAAEQVVASEDRVMTLGVRPRWPETGYGYLELGDEADPESGVRRVVRFTEKPDKATAQRFVTGGHHLWNAGIFLFTGNKLLSLLQGLLPELARGLEAISSRPERIDSLYPDLPAVSIDTGVMEKLEDIFTLPLDCGWNDLGSWAALAEILPVDNDGNAVRGDVLSLDSSGNVLYSESGMVAVVGVEDLVVVRTGDAVLVVPKERCQSVRELVREIAAVGRRELL